MTVKSFFIAVLASLLCFSCSETNLESTQIANTQEEPKVLYTYDVDIEATSETPKDSTQATRIADMPFKITEENLGEKNYLVPKINIKKDIVESVVVFYNKSTDEKTVQQAKWKVIAKGANIKLRLQQLSSYAKFQTGEWYLMSFIGGGNLQGEQLKVQTKTTLNVIAKDQEIETSCPFATPWRQIVYSNNKLTLKDPKTKMDFAPQGVFLTLNVESNMSLNTKLDREIRLESNAFTSTGAYNFNITKTDVKDKADIASNYWEPTGIDQVKRPYPTYIECNGQQYVTRFKLNYQASVPDGSNRNGKTDLENSLYFDKLRSQTYSGKTTYYPQKTKQFLLCVMPVDPKKTAKKNTGVTTEALFYGKVFIDDDTRTRYTYDQLTYKENPDTWKPYMESRYLLGSFSDNLQKGSCHNLTLRIVRPMLPIERLWVVRQGTQGDGIQEAYMKPTNRNDAEAFAEGNKTEGGLGYPGLTNHRYRFPKYSELMPILNNCELQIDKNQPLGDIHGYDIVSEYGRALAIKSHGDWVNINGKQMKFDNWFCAQPDGTVLYGIMYMKPFKPRGNTTGNYKVAYRMSFKTPQKNDGTATIQMYYLGPNYNLSYAVAAYYCCHDQFWDKLTERDYIERRFPLGGDYWLNDKEELHQSGEIRSLFNGFSLNGVQQSANTSIPRKKYCFFLPWLKEPAW